MNFKWFIDNLWQILINILGGACTAALVTFYIKIKNRLHNLIFKNIFGFDIESLEGFHLVYGELGLKDSYNQKGEKDRYPYIKPIPVPRLEGYGFSIERPISSCEVRAAKYLASNIGKEMKNSPDLTSDISIIDKLDLSFISLGGPASNHKTNDVLINESNKLVSLRDNDFVSVSSNQRVITREIGFDYGLILKINPEQFPGRIWISCFGIGEWGTSGAAWYLANKWERIYKYAKNKPFAIIVKVRPNQDQSAAPIFMAKTQDEIEKGINKCNDSKIKNQSMNNTIPGSGDYRGG